MACLVTYDISSFGLRLKLSVYLLSGLISLPYWAACPCWSTLLMQEETSAYFLRSEGRALPGKFLKYIGGARWMPSLFFRNSRSFWTSKKSVCIWSLLTQRYHIFGNRKISRTFRSTYGGYSAWHDDWPIRKNLGSHRIFFILALIKKNIIIQIWKIQIII